MDDMTRLYERIAQIPSSLVPVDIQEIYPTITQEDIDRATVERYFCKLVNQPSAPIIEIDAETFGVLSQNARYLTLQLTWRIAGPIEDVIDFGIRKYTGVKTANSITLANAERDMPGITAKLRNLIQYWRK